MQAKALLDSGKRPTENEIKHWLAENLLPLHTTFNRTGR